MTNSLSGGAPLNAQTRDLLDRLEQPGLGVIEDLYANGTPDPLPVTHYQMQTAVRPYSWLLNQLRHGITLTNSGYLPPDLVHQTMTELGWDKTWIGSSNREHHTLPVLELRQSAQHCRLLRKYRGRLLLTRQGLALHNDPVALWLHLAHHAVTHDDSILSDAGTLLLLAVASGQPLSRDNLTDLLEQGLHSLGWRQPDGQPLELWHVLHSARDTWQHLDRLGAITSSPKAKQAVAPPAAGPAFARAALRSPTATPGPRRQRGQ